MTNRQRQGKRARATPNAPNAHTRRKWHKTHAENTTMEEEKTIPMGVTMSRLSLLIILQLLKQVAHIVEREGADAQQLLSIKHPHHQGLRG